MKKKLNIHRENHALKIALRNNTQKKRHICTYEKSV